MNRNSSKNIAKLSSGILGFLIILVIILAVNVIIHNVNLRMDITEDRIYTLSDGTKTILAKTENPVTLKLFFSRSSAEVPAYLKTYADHVENVLDEYEIAGKGKIEIQKIDPKPDSDAEEWAQEYGIHPATVDVFGPPVYFGLVASSGNIEAVIPMLDPNREEVLEYNITRMIQRISSPRKPKVGLMSSLPVMGIPEPRFQMPGQPPQGRAPWIAFRELQNDYDLVAVSPDAETIDPGIDALLLIHPKELSQKTLFAIDQFILRGGRMLAFIDPSSNADRETSMMPMQFGGMSNTSDLNPLLNAWGVGYDPAKMIADMQCVTALQGANGDREETPIWLSMTAQNMRNDIVTSQIESLLMPVAGVLSDGTDKELEFTPLVTSSETSCTMDASLAQFGSQAVKKDFRPGGVKYTLAARLTGKFKTAFPDGITIEQSANHEEEGGDEETEEKKEEKIGPGLLEGESAVIIVADVDMLYDRFTVREVNFFGATTLQPFNDNLVFFVNALEQVAGSTDLITVRSRVKSARPFEKVLALESAARVQWQERENDLMQKLEELKSNLNELQAGKDHQQQMFLTKEQEETIRAFEKEQRAIEKDLKNVRKNLRKDIEVLGMKVKFANILLMPLIISLGGICFGIYRKHKS